MAQTKLEWPVCKHCNETFNQKSKVLAHHLDDEYVTFLIHEECADAYAQATMRRSSTQQIALHPVLLNETMRQMSKILRKVKA